MKEIENVINWNCIIEIWTNVQRGSLYTRTS